MGRAAKQQEHSACIRFVHRFAEQASIRRLHHRVGPEHDMVRVEGKGSLSFRLREPKRERDRVFAGQRSFVGFRRLD